MPSRKPIVILMAEDDEDYFFFTQEAIKQFHLLNELRRVADGEELMDNLLHRGKYENAEDAPRPGLIFLDINMPRKTGLEALQEIKAHPALRQIPVVMLTISKDKKDIEKCYQYGANSFVTKPLGFEELVGALKVIKDYWFQIVELPFLA
ncbi:MAG: response regulator [Candidatus Omnitrophica bacterium]|nr:response regulator [Candidatus Omnitrophota bacterium]